MPYDWSHCGPVTKELEYQLEIRTVSYLGGHMPMDSFLFLIQCCDKSYSVFMYHILNSFDRQGKYNKKQRQSE